MYSGASAFKGDDSGATAVEYALMVAAIAAAIVVVVFALGIQVRGLFENASNLWAAQR